MPDRKWCEFRKVSSSPIVYNIYHVESKNYLGQIKWYSAFRQYCYYWFSDTEEIILAPSCMEQITKFARDLTKERNKVRKELKTNSKNNKV